MTTESLLIHAAYPTPVVARVTAPDEPGSTWGGGWYDSSGWYGPPGGSAGYDWPTFFATGGFDEAPLSDYQCLNYSVVYRCIAYISQTIASLAWHEYERQDDGRTRLPIEDDTAWLLDLQASPEMSAFDWRQVMIKDALTQGNGYAEIERTKGGRPYWLHRVDPYRVSVERDDDGLLFYAVRNPLSGEYRTLDPDNVFHLKNLGPDGLVGWSMLRLARYCIELGLSQEQYGRIFFKRGPTPGGLLEIPGVVKKEERDAMRESFQKTYGGAKNAGRVIVLTGGAKFSPLTLANDDAQWLDSRAFQAEELARFFGVPLSKLGLLDKTSFSTTEQMAIEAVQDCLLPWCRRLETEADIKLFGRTNRGRRFTKLNLATLLRGDAATQTETVTKKVTAGINTVNEARDYFDLNPIEGGDTALVQGAMVRLDAVLAGETTAQSGKAPAPAPAPAPASPPDMIPEDMRRAFEPLLTSLYADVLRVESEKANRANNKGQLPAWAKGFYNGHQQHVEKVLTPLLVAALLWGKHEAEAPALAARLSALHVDESLRTLLNVGISGASSWNGDTPPENSRAARQAGRHMSLVLEAMR